MMRILIAPNAFKNSLDATAAANAIRVGLMESRLNCECNCFPIGDGGDGTCDLIVKRLGGELIETIVDDPFGKAVTANFGLVDDGKTAIIEMAHASGIGLVEADQLNPLRASSFGTGQQIKTALDRGVKKIVIAMGGSATVDAGFGILAALGLRFFDRYGNQLGYAPEELADLFSIDPTGLHPALSHCEIIVLCDVNNLLLGEQGSAKTFGPQKGASPEAVEILEKILSNMAAVSLQQTGKDMAAVERGGTAGGAAAGLYAWINVSLVNGIDHFLALTGFDVALENADLVITGEGSIDEQTLQNKGPFGVALRAKQKRIPVIGIAGKIPLEISPSLHGCFDVLLPISQEPLEIAAALKQTAANLKRTGYLIGNMLAVNTSLNKEN